MYWLSAFKQLQPGADKMRHSNEELVLCMDVNRDSCIANFGNHA